MAGGRNKETLFYNITTQVIRSILGRYEGVEIRLGSRHRRVVSIVEQNNTIVPNLFQMSSGEISLLNLFLCILRDFDLCGTPMQTLQDVRGIVVVDEADLHLDAIHQYKILPRLLRVFPKVQFVLTTHSPLFVLGMKEIFEETGFGLYRLPHGHRISPEEFSEFADAYHAFTQTVKFNDDVRTAVQNAQKPILFVEGTTDEKYLRISAKLLGQQPMLDQFEIRDGNGARSLKNIWSGFAKIPPNFLSQKVVILFDCDYGGDPEDLENRFKRKIPEQVNHPIRKGIENLFGKSTIELARVHKPAFIDIDHERQRTERGTTITVPEKWSVNKDEKTNLCDWLCDHGTLEDFQHFSKVFDLLREILEPEPHPPLASDQPPQ